MRSLLSTALLLPALHATTQEETSLMQGLVARRGQLTPDAKEARKDATARLMETATKMMKNGATPDVIVFIETTITEVHSNVLSAIVEEHHRDQQLIYDLLARFDAAVATMEACAESIRQQQADREEASAGHKLCRSEESVDCAFSRRCEEELEEKWRRVVIEEEEMRRIHWHIYDEWCEGPGPFHPSLADPFQWTLSHHFEGDETSQSLHEYPVVDLAPNIIEFRRFSVEYFGMYIEQLPRVEIAWTEYWAKLTECAALEETWQLKVDECDAAQGTLRDAACMHASTNRQCASNFGHEYEMTMTAYLEACETIRQLEYDRKREWETLHIVTCLLETVYTHVIHAIDSGEPCPTTESHPEETENEINYCHVIEEELTRNLTIDYGEPPPYPDLPPPLPAPCTAEYIWEEHGSFPFELQSSHSLNLESNNLQDYNAVISAFGWAGCAAPKACIPCEVEDLVVDPDYVDNQLCKAHHSHLLNGQMDWDTFKCVDGTQCIRAAGRCNGVANCDDGSDETACDTPWGVPAIPQQSEQCPESFTEDTHWRCGDLSCIHIAGRCNGVWNCPGGSDEIGCATTTQDVTIEASSGYTATITQPAVTDVVFFDRTYTFDSLGSFAGHSFVKMSNEDKHIRGDKVQMKIRLPQPMIVYVAKLDSTPLPWLQVEGWTLSTLQGVSYSGVRATRHTDWSGVLTEDHYGPGEVWQKTFPAGVVEMRGNNGGDGSYVMFVAHTGNPVTPLISEGDLRLSGDSDHRGRLEVYHEGQWGTICDDHFSHNDAQVACTQLGFPDNNYHELYTHGGGSGQIWLDDINCNDFETRLGQCSHRGWGSHNCGHHEDVGVECSAAAPPTGPNSNEPGSEGSLRLSGGNTPNRGRLEIFHDGEWGTICDDAFDLTDAGAACRQLGFTNGAAMSYTHGGGSGTIHLDNLGCNSESDRVDQCDHNGWGRHNCGHHEDVGVECVANCEWEMSSNVQLVGNVFTKQGGGSHYNADATICEQTEVSVRANQNNMHVRLGLTSDASDDHVYPHGRYVGLFPNGRMYLPPFGDNTYAVGDTITMRLSGGSLSVLKNGNVLATWGDDISAQTLFARLHFYENDAGMTLM